MVFDAVFLCEGCRFLVEDGVEGVFWVIVLCEAFSIEKGPTSFPFFALGLIRASNLSTWCSLSDFKGRGGDFNDGRVRGDG